MLYIHVLLFIDLGLRINKILLWIAWHQHASKHIEEKTILLSFFIKIREGTWSFKNARVIFVFLNLLSVTVLATFCCKIFNDGAGSDTGLP